MTHSPNKSASITPVDLPDDQQVATFASGCFWCMEAIMQETAGVKEVVSGYAGGEEADPTYEDVYSGRTGHREAVQVFYNPKEISYEELLNIFWKNIDPTDPDGQFVDKGFSYTTAVFYHSEEQKRLTDESVTDLEDMNLYNGKPIVTKVLPYTTFYRAEEYHQDFYKKNKPRYEGYSNASGRKQYKEKIWGEILKQEQQAGNNSVTNSSVSATENTEAEEKALEISASKTYTKPEDSQIREMLSDIQYDVTQKNATEKPFDNEYWDNTEPGIYVDVVSGEPLFSSTTKFKSGTGWPSFYEPLVPDNIVKKSDFLLIIPRTEVRSKNGDSHLGHVFKDGPQPSGLRYCMNSAAMRFVHKDDLVEEGYEEFGYLFD